MYALLKVDWTNRKVPIVFVSENESAARSMAEDAIDARDDSFRYHTEGDETGFYEYFCTKNHSVLLARLSPNDE